MPSDYTGLLSGSYWTGIEVTAKPTIVTYSFPATGARPSYIASLDDPNLTHAAIASYQGFDVSEQALARTALAEWGNASGLVFIEVAAGKGDINFQKLDFTGTGYQGAGGIAYHPFGDWNFASHPYFTSDLDASGDVFMNSAMPIVYGTLLHEIGHALGLKHPTEAWTQYAADPPVDHSVWDVDNPNLTIMSQLPGGTGHLTTIDIQAIQAVYGTQAQDGSQVASWSWSALKQTLTQTGFATDDAIRGSSVIDVINGGNGNDKLFGLNGNDRLNGGDGEDLLDGGPGADKLAGGKGNDTYFVDASGDRITEAAAEGTDWVYASVTHKMAANVENLVVLGNAKVNITGSAVANEIYGNSAGDTLAGGAGDDYIVGGAAKDKIVGGAGADVVFGGGGNDSFVFSSYGDFDHGLDAIGDFSHAEGDKIDLRTIDPNAAISGNQAFTFIGTAAFTGGSPFQVRYEVSNGNALIQIDADRDAVADHEILLYGVSNLVPPDFVL